MTEDQVVAKAWPGMVWGHMALREGPDIQESPIKWAGMWVTPETKTLKSPVGPDTGTNHVRQKQSLEPEVKQPRSGTQRPTRNTEPASLDLRKNTPHGQLPGPEARMEDG